MTQIHTLSKATSDRDLRIRTAQEAVIARMTAAPEKARSTLTTHGRVDEGLACRVSQGKFEATLDLGPGMGGDAAGPSPGFFARAAIVGCVAIAVKMLAARGGIRFEAVDVKVEMEFDDAALFGIGDGNAAPVATRILVAITTDADQGVVQDIVRRALDMDPWFLALRDPQKVSARVTLAGDA
ncbi:OsmC family protein [Frigidibacter sp. RF13]|uniref:OsmC family protein n=1 Tax=Frigidibacter sp. RF13 TaxID=2997340 RepID=UPI00226FE47D|nr:OsmC family protein [Frigidibacter sp. RF13]MCY1128493.1 OsmC family protein [Frigidibacter sp. RF13]